jgi:ribonuclease Y
VGETAIVVALLIACLVALILVLIARREAEATRAKATEDAAAIKDEARAHVAELQRREDRLGERETEVTSERRRLHEAADQLDSRAREVDERAKVVEAEQRAARGLLDTAREEAGALLESASGLSQQEARAEQVRRVLAEAEHDAAAQVRRIEARARRTAEDRARQVIATAVHRMAGPTSAQSVVTVVPLPAEDMKGRVIGKEGRNIRTFEALTGVNVIIDDSSDQVTLSSFDAERREVAAVALHALIADGRIHPQRIELAYAEALAGARDRAVAAGHEAAEKAGVRGLHPEIVETLGRLRLRVSYGQNVLAHLVEAAQLASVMAVEIGADPELARRAALLHDIGKALTPEQSGTHAALGAALLRRLGEADLVVNAVAAHHDEVPMESVEAVLVQAADAASASRPGARREELDAYVERMSTLESLVTAHAGVRRAVAMSAGREVRVIVEPELVDDAGLPDVAAAIARQIEADLSYPGEITVTVIREIRASATAG